MDRRNQRHWRCSGESAARRVRSAHAHRRLDDRQRRADAPRRPPAYEVVRQRERPARALGRGGRSV